ncbi:hypothetical protein J8655_10000 [Dickeya oryzae]|uniref:transcription termination/antitermination NusG family protein n=1 Tax=Dickeya oryzae TaxID=1240404 RepID=UPI001AEC883B|nr:transcription termination/antitermination NusG family protein [Dickeya oryzae]MBP2845810.1 hypothetical protein [Dickeya oryzae]
MNQWYLLYCKTGYKTTNKRLSELGVKVFEASLTTMSKRTDCNAYRFRKIPLFPNYVFVSFDINDIHTTTLREIPGVVDFVRRDNAPCIIPDRLIHSIELIAKKEAEKRSLNKEIRLDSNDIFVETPVLLSIISLVSPFERQLAFQKFISAITH